ncbi:MAG: AraC family transcriptional regulator [Paracoccaceae bacterium]
MTRSLPLSRFNVLTTEEPDVALESVRLRQPGVRTLDPPRSRSWRLVSNAATLGPVTLVASESGGYAIDTEPAGQLRVPMPLFGSMALVDRGEEIDLGRAEAFFVPATRGRVAFRPGSGLVLLSADADAVAEAMRLLDCEADPVPLADRFAAEPRLPGLSTFRRTVVGAIREIEDLPERILLLDRFRRARSEALLLHLADVLARATAPRATRERPKSRVVRRALDYIETTPPEAFSYAGLAASAGVSLRTVQIAFRRELETTVGEWVRRRRLAKARALLREGPPDLTVTQAAELAGFYHPGRFAAAYRAVFGENPSETARRRRA